MYLEEVLLIWNLFLTGSRKDCFQHTKGKRIRRGETMETNTSYETATNFYPTTTVARFSITK